MFGNRFFETGVASIAYGRLANASSGWLATADGRVYQADCLRAVRIKNRDDARGLRRTLKQWNA